MSLVEVSWPHQPHIKQWQEHLRDSLTEGVSCVIMEKHILHAVLDAKPKVLTALTERETVASMLDCELQPGWS